MACPPPRPPVRELVEGCGGDIFSIQDFIDATKCGALTNDDGSGYLSNGIVIWNIPVDCSHFSRGITPHNLSAYSAELTHVVWFNK